MTRDILSHMKHITSLYLSLELERIEPDAFVDLSDLKELDLGFNNFVNLDDWTCFDPLESLRELNLSCCKIESISSRTFAGLKNLQELNLERNPIIDQKNKSEKVLELLKTSYSLPNKCRIVVV
jgi:Leucine-rich repeat (LRR) protein